MSYVPFEEVVKFHGHLCGGVASGYALGKYAMELIGAKPGDPLYAVVEFQNCMTDAIQMVTGCTTGKGNLVVRNLDKGAITLVKKETGKGVRVVIDNMHITGETPEELAKNIIEADPKTTCTYREATLEVPARRPKKLIKCDKCGETFSEYVAEYIDGKILCPDCVK